MLHLAPLVHPVQAGGADCRWGAGAKGKSEGNCEGKGVAKGSRRPSAQHSARAKCLRAGGCVASDTHEFGICDNAGLSSQQFFSVSSWSFIHFCSSIWLLR
eukprot:3535636-Pleurochrysis_carterae.AAC.1